MENYELYIAEPPRRPCMKGTYKKNGRRKRLNKEEIARFISLFPDEFNWKLERMFDISSSTVNKLKHRYGLNKSHTIMSLCRFKKGEKAWNKGKKGINTGGEQGQFKKGNLPKNHRHIGSIRLQRNNNRGEQYFYIKTEEPNKWKPLHRHIWEQNFGEIPPGFCVVFKDKNVLNTEISNLELITRAKNMERNRNRKKASESMRKLWHIEKLRASYGLKRKSKLRIK